MSGSFDRIDYSIRPAKYAERRMLRDVFRRVAPFGPPEDYLYVGMGSVWFADFSLFHRSLGIKDMISIESATKALQRVKDNAPFRIELAAGRSETELPKMELKRRCLIWLDYDDALSPNMLQDLRTVASRVESGSVLAITVRAERAREVDQENADADETGRTALERFKSTFARARIPQNLDGYDLAGRPFAALSRSILSSEIETALVARSRKEEDEINFHPICSFNYADGVLMTTTVGMFCAATDTPTYATCDFGSLPFVHADQSVFTITVPKITTREFRLLEAQMPSDLPVALGSIPEREAENFGRLYRYLPNYAVLEN
jgi:hypothetical protein